MTQPASPRTAFDLLAHIQNTLHLLAHTPSTAPAHPTRSNFAATEEWDQCVGNGKPMASKCTTCSNPKRRSDRA
jgi:hypothetical protein